MPLYIEKKLMVTSTNRPTDQQGEYRAICLFRKLENRKRQRFAIILTGMQVAPPHKLLILNTVLKLITLLRSKRGSGMGDVP